MKLYITRNLSLIMTQSKQVQNLTNVIDEEKKKKKTYFRKSS